MISVLLTLWFVYLALSFLNTINNTINFLVLCTHEMEIKIKLRAYYILNACFSSISFPLLLSLSLIPHTYTTTEFFPYPSYILGFKGYLGIQFFLFVKFCVLGHTQGEILMVTLALCSVLIPDEVLEITQNKNWTLGFLHVKHELSHWA